MVEALLAADESFAQHLAHTPVEALARALVYGADRAEVAARLAQRLVGVYVAASHADAAPAHQAEPEHPRLHVTRLVQCLIEIDHELAAQVITACLSDARLGSSAARFVADLAVRREGHQDAKSHYDAALHELWRHRDVLHLMRMALLKGGAMLLEPSRGERDLARHLDALGDNWERATTGDAPRTLAAHLAKDEAAARRLGEELAVRFRVEWPSRPRIASFVCALHAIEPRAARSVMRTLLAELPGAMRTSFAALVVYPPDAALGCFDLDIVRADPQVWSLLPEEWRRRAEAGHLRSSGG